MDGIRSPLLKRRKASRRLFTEMPGAFRASLDLRSQRRLIRFPRFYGKRNATARLFALQTAGFESPTRCPLGNPPPSALTLPAIRPRSSAIAARRI
jgi:hypothetical protein